MNANNHFCYAADTMHWH